MYMYVNIVDVDIYVDVVQNSGSGIPENEHKLVDVEATSSAWRSDV